MRTYFDTSYLVALYVPNAHSPAALRHRTRNGNEPIVFTPLHRLELRTTVRQCAFSHLITPTAARQILNYIHEDLADGTLMHQGFQWTESLREAEAVAERQAWDKSCRSLDLWHVAAALQMTAESFVTFDKDQFALAKAEGLATTYPR